MKKMIYAVKNGRKTGIFREWLKCSEQTNKYSHAKFRGFAYRSDLAEEPEDVPGSLRCAIKEAEAYLGDLVYLGESVDCLEDMSWVEDGFLPFGSGPETENPEFFSDRGEDEEEDIGDIEEEYEECEEYDEWLADNKNTSDALGESWEIEYWKIAEDMRKCVELIKHGRSDTEKKTAASDLKRHLERCLADVNLSDLTAIYKDLKEENVIGYNPPAVARFVTRLLNRYPKP